MNCARGGDYFIHRDGCSSHSSRTRAVSKKNSILTSRAVFANHLPSIGVLNGNSDSTGCMREGREEYAIILSFFIHICFFSSRCRPFFELSASLNALSVGNGI